MATVLDNVRAFGMTSRIRHAVPLASSQCCSDVITVQILVLTCQQKSISSYGHQLIKILRLLAILNA